jgi:UDP-galactose transporter B1
MSVVYFAHPLTPKQWLGTLLVFVGLTLESLYGKEPKRPAAAPVARQ